MNFKLLQIELKKIWIILFFFCLIAIILIVPTIMGNETLSSLTHVTITGPGSSISSTTQGAGGTFFATIVIATTMFFSFLLSIILIYKVFIREINFGFIGYFLTLPLSRTEIFINKTIVIIGNLIIYHLISFFFQEIFYVSLMKDFTSNVALYLFILTITMFFVSIVFFGFSLLLVLLIKNINISLSIISVLGILFYVFYLFYAIAPEKENTFYVLKYFTILSFIQESFNFSTNKIIHQISDNSYEYYYLSYFDYFKLSWKLPIVIILSGLFILPNVYIFKNKEFYI